MARLVWFVLNDGRSVVAGCAGETRESLAGAIARPDSTLTLTRDDSVERLSSEEIRDFVVYEAKASVPSATAIYRLVHTEC